MVSDAWKTGSGLLDEYEMTLDEVWFGKDKNYQDGKALLFRIRGEAIVDGEVVDEEKENFYSVGDGWDTDDGGETASHGSGKNTVNKNSNFGKFIDAVVAQGDDVLKVIAERGDPTEAATWQGLTFRFERKEYQYTDRKTGEKREYGVELPVEFLGDTNEEEAPKKKAPAKKAKKSASKTKAKAKAEPADDEDEAEEEAPKKSRRKSKKAETNDNSALRAVVVAFAEEYEDHADFMADVLDPDEFDQAEELQADEELLNDVLDEDGEIWTESREEE